MADGAKTSWTIDEQKDQHANRTHQVHNWHNAQYSQHFNIDSNFVLHSSCFLFSTLLDDRHALISKNNEMLRDMLILRKKLENYKNVLPKWVIRCICLVFINEKCLKKIYCFFLLSLNDASTNSASPMYRYASDPQINNVSAIQKLSVIYFLFTWNVF